MEQSFLVSILHTVTYPVKLRQILSGSTHVLLTSCFLVTGCKIYRYLRTADKSLQIPRKVLFSRSMERRYIIRLSKHYLQRVEDVLGW